MAHLWIPVDTVGKRGWAMAELEGADKFALTGDRSAPVRTWRDGDETRVAGCICRIRSGVRESWVLLAPSGSPVRVAGRPLWTGIRTLREGEELRVDGSGRFFFSLTRKPHATPYPLDDQRSCARCWQPLKKGETAVRCPGCGAWHHQVDGEGDAGRLCWTYSTPAAMVAATCARCPTPVALGARYRPLPLTFWDGAIPHQTAESENGGNGAGMNTGTGGTEPCVREE